MFHKKTIKRGELLNALNGTTRVEGADGAGSSGSPNFTSAGSTFQTDNVAVGDIVYIDGEGEFVVDSVTDENNLVLDSNLSQTLSGASFRISYGRLINDWDTEVKNCHFDDEQGQYTLVYERTPPSFTVSS